MGSIEVEERDDACADASARAPVRSLAYQPALDGVRAVAVVLVLLFHAGFGWMRGGYVGVSVFFTLSGFLITSLMITEHRRTAAIALPEFFGRRLRRLLPASLLCLVGVAIARVAGAFDTGPPLRGQLIAAAADVYNWTQIAGTHSYTDTLAGSPTLLSPLEHYWSLAIEEQFYLVWPLAMTVVLSRTRRPFGLRRALVGLFLGSALVAFGLASRFGGDVAYWSTLARLPELLAGAALAGLVLTHSVPRGLGKLALPALVGVVACAVWFPASSGPAYSGTMSVFALLSVLLIAGLQTDSVLRRGLSARPLVGLGTISYGVYLFHWPIFVWARQRGWDLTSPVVFALTVAAVLALAKLSYIAIERPIRRARVAPSIAITAAGGATLAAIALFVAVPFSRGFLEADDDALAQASAVAGEQPVALVAGDDPSNAVEVADPRTSPSTSPGTSAVAPVGAPGLPDGAVSSTVSADTSEAVVTTEAPAVVVTDIALPDPSARPARILTVGDSTAFYVGQAFAQWTLDHPDHTRSDLVWCQGCGLILDGTITSWDAEPFVEQSNRVYRELLPDALARVQPDAVVMMTTIDDVTNRQWSDDEGPLTPFDAPYRERMLAGYRNVAATLEASDAGLVVWVKPPVPIWPGPHPEMKELERWDVLESVIDQIVAENVDRMIAVDADAWMHAAGRADDDSFRPDGTHMTEESAYEMVDRWLAPLVLTDLASTGVASR